MADTPSCPVSFPQATPGAPVFHKGSPYLYAPPQHIVNQVNSIPRAHDLPSVINALNIMANIVTQITRNAPQVNNLVTNFDFPGGISAVLKGQEFGQQYGPADWIQEDRNYEVRHAVNPDDHDQSIAIKVLTNVTFSNKNTGYLLEYEGTDAVTVL